MFENFFGAKKISIQSLASIEEGVPNIIVWAAPVMFFFVLLEYFISRWQNKKLYSRSETIGSTLVGLGNVAIGLVLKMFLLWIFIAIYNLIPWRMPFHWWTFIPCYILFDFCSYWAHNVSHRLRFFWATHVAHHTGEHYNLTISFRLSWVQYFKIIFFLPVAFLGFHPIILFVTNQIAVLFQFWVHTEYIKKMPRIIEYIFATPSNHRVHHGSQEKYINKNYGATFIFWDRIFGTFQEETERPIYGITHNIDHKHDPIHINFHEYYDIVRDVKQADGWREGLFYIFGNPSDIDTYKRRKAGLLQLAKEENTEH
jgi:sterol desaturase/sphingolipid hydroxylase (fatty acid hydroxylase superfamily)